MGFIKRGLQPIIRRLPHKVTPQIVELKQESLLQGVSTDNIYHPTNLIGRYILPIEIANMAVVLVSEMGRSIVGDIIYMTGGSGNVTNEDLPYDF